MDLLLNPEIWISFFTLAVLEIVLGIDNVLFLSIVSQKLPEHQQAKARTIGLVLALLMRIALLFSIAWIAGLTADAFTIFDHNVSWRDIILGVGGLFLLYKGTTEIHDTIEIPGEHSEKEAKSPSSFASVITQIVVLDAVFSLDSVLTAVGMTDELFVMIAAVTVAIIIMMVAAGPTSRFVQKHPSVKMLALSFLLLIGVALLADALHFHIPRGYLYFAIAFSIGVEILNLMARKRRLLKR